MPATSVWPRAVKMNVRPSGKNHGLMCADCCAVSFVTGAGTPPLAGIRMSGVVTLGANKMTPSAFQDPPLPANAGARTWGAPPPISTLFSTPAAKNAIERLSGDQKGQVAPSVPESGCGDVAARERSQRRDPRLSDATNTILFPSGERANAE